MGQNLSYIPSDSTKKDWMINYNIGGISKTRVNNWLFTFVIGYCYLIIFIGWMLKILHCPTEIGIPLVQCLDYIPFLLLINSKLRNDFICLPNCIGFWVLIFIFLIFSILTTLVNGGRISSSVIHFGIIFRYAPLASILYCCHLRNPNVMTFYKHFCIISFILVAIGYLELLGGIKVREFFRPLGENDILVNEDEINILVDYTIYGIFPNAVDYTFFLILSYVIVSSSKSHLNNFFLFIIYIIPIYWSGSKAGLLIFLIIATYKDSSVKLIKNVIILVVSIVLLYLLYNYWELFYWTLFIDSKKSRLGYIIFTLPSFLSELSFNTFFGTSPDKDLVYYKINSFPNAPMMTWNKEMMSSFEDEFYVALTVFYGLFGFAILLIIYIGLFINLRRITRNNKLFDYTFIIKAFSIILIIAPLFNQIIILKPFSLFFWCWIGIILSQDALHPHNNLKSNRL